MGRFKRKIRTKTKKLAKTNQPKESLYSKLFKDVALSVKKRKEFGDFINTFQSPKYFIANDEHWLHYVHASNGRRITLHIGDVALIHHPRCFTKEYSNGILNRLVILYFTLLRKKDTTYDSRKVLEYYAHDQFSSQGRKIYPNELVFSITFGALFAALGMVLTLSLAAFFFSCGVSLIYSTLWTMMLGGFWIKLKHSANVF